MVAELANLTDEELEAAKLWRIPGEHREATLPDIFAEQQRRAAERLTTAALRLARWNMVVAIVAVVVAVALGIVQIATR